MGNIIQHLRGSVVDHSTYTGKKGEISLVTDASEARIPTGEIRIHDDSTPGGLPIVLGTTTNPLTSNIVLGSGVGINFHNYGSEDSNSATTVGNNLLDDYEEGTWTPTLTTSETPPAFTVSGNPVGYYTKVGRLVHVQFYIRPNLSSAGTGIPKITGLPFAPNYYPPVSLGISNLLNDGQTSDNYINGTEALLYNATLKTGLLAYITFTATYYVL